jgi:hypothetical protein
MTDGLRISHVYQGRNATSPVEIEMQPQPNTAGKHRGLYEVLYRHPDQGRGKRSFHVTLQELVELYARGLVVMHGLRLRVRPADGRAYPAAPPGKVLTERHIVAGSRFEAEVRAFDRSGPVSADLARKLLAVGI